MSAQPLPPVYRAHLDAVTGSDPDALRAVWEPDGILEFPYAVSLGTPTRLTGIDAIVDYFSTLGLFGPFSFTDARAWPTTGDDGWVAELHGSSVVLSTGAPYEQDYIVRFGISSGGRIEWMREYWDPTRAGG